MAKRFSGSTRSLSIEGIEFGVAADADINSILSKWEKEVLMSSGSPMVKLTTVNQSKKGFDVLADAEEKEQLKAFSESFDDLKIVYKDAAGNEFHCQATISLGESTSQDNKVPVDVYPIKGNPPWTVVYA